ncbi:hypothetical protein LY632_04720 [Erythrobacter sp. SDW2]|uniref:hypothetical protein n=1 Tax=Erythrobacter sp. SDW2 TaxID=2907154 RepID=UPI001F2AFC53|nr:hypothetical protein [Erythrobacter sp. SDW2]UIP07707.1 hypothetical protein LY632_04720 [Erythrobacter sp. SDW2]
MWFSMSSLRLFVAMIGIGLWATTQTVKAEGFDAWQIHTTDTGCLAYSYQYSFADMENDPSPMSYVWLGPPCTPGQPINGEGMMLVMQRQIWEDGEIYRVAWLEKGRWANGYKEGQFETREYEVDAAGRIPLDNPRDLPPDFIYSTFTGGCLPNQMMMSGVTDFPGFNADDYTCKPRQIRNPIRIRQVAPYFEVPESLRPKTTVAAGPPALFAKPAPASDRTAAISPAKPVSGPPAAGVYGSYGNPLEVMDASDCLIYRSGPGSGLWNKCPYDVVYEVCVVNPQTSSGQWYPCVPGKPSGGLWTARASQVPSDAKSEADGSGAHLYWFACRYDRTEGPQFFDRDAKKEAVFQTGRGLVGGQCIAWADLG